jgi:hypothetical protein
MAPARLPPSEFLMPKIRRISLPWTTGFTKVNTGDGTFIPMTPWMPAADIAQAGCTFEAVETCG